MKTQRGRPPKKPSERQTERLEIRFTAEEFAALTQAADGKLATWAREALLKAARRSR